MVINILSPGRFHVCDLTRELHANGFDVKFYSFVPQRRTCQFGVPKECSASLAWVIAPLAYMERHARYGRRFFRFFRRNLQDMLTSLFLRRADVTIALSGEFNHSVKKAKKQGSIIICERGSKHIIDQKLILDSNPFVKNKTVSGRNVKRELLSYELADYIAVGAKHVEDSFLKRGYNKEKLFLNPYGVSLKNFYAIDCPKKYDFIMVGNWCYGKGCDLIAEAIKMTNYSFVHVGSIDDVPFPDQDPRFTQIPATNEMELQKYYNQAKIFVLPSRQEGLAMVQVQALACNLPIIASVDSGGSELKDRVENPEYITLLEEYEVDTLMAEMERMLAKYEDLKGRTYAGEAIASLSWEAYGKRYAEFLQKITRK